MPLVGSVGHSAHTPDKQLRFSKLLRWHVDVVRHAMQKHAWIHPFYTYTDLYAGAGGSQEDEFTLPGSPLLALRILREYAMPARVTYIEHEPESAASLRQYLYGTQDLSASNLDACGHIQYSDMRSTYDVFCQDHALLMPQLLATWSQQYPVNQLYGLIYADPNGPPDFALLRQCAEALPRVDLLIHFGANTLKRKRRSTHHPFEHVLADQLATIPKQYWLIGKPDTAWQWTFLFGTNWKGVKDWQSQGLHRMQTAIGQRYLRALSYTKDELEVMHGQQQGYLFDVQ